MNAKEACEKPESVRLWEQVWSTRSFCELMLIGLREFKIDPETKELVYTGKKTVRLVLS